MQLALLSREITYTYLVTQFFASCSQHSQLFVNLQDIDSLSIDSHTFIITCRYIYAISLLRGLQNSILRLIRLCCTRLIMSQLISLFSFCSSIPNNIKFPFLMVQSTFRQKPRVALILINHWLKITILSLSLSGMIHAHFFLRTDSVYANLQYLSDFFSITMYN